MLVTTLTALEEARVKAGKRPAVLIVGAGAVGLFLAQELRKAKPENDVILIEAGDTVLGNFDPESYVSVGVKHDGIRIGRSRTLGGTTNLWGGQLVEFQPVDFNGREWIPGSRWPVSFKEIAEYYAQTYESLGVPAERHSDAPIWRSIGVSPPSLGPDLETFLTRWLAIPNFAILFRKSIDADPGLLVVTGHPVVGFSAGVPDHVDAVRVHTPAGVCEVAADCFVLAAGTIENVRLMLTGAHASGPRCAWEGNANVGAGFQDHLGGRVATVHPTDTRTFFNAFSTIALGGAKYEPKFRLRNNILAREDVLNAHGMFDFESSASQHLVYLKQFLKAAVFGRRITGFTAFLRNAHHSARYLFPLMWRYVWEHRIFIPGTSKISLYLQMEQFPIAESRIAIDPTQLDAVGLPRVVLDWRLRGGIELESLRAFTLRASDALRNAGLARLEIDDDLLEMRPRFLSTLSDTVHQSGGTMMGWTAQDGVVDRNLRVFGTTNLYVAGSSVFRTISNANTTFTALAFASRLAKHLSSNRL